MPSLELEFACTVRARVAAPVISAEGPDGLRRFIPIVGGTFEGPLLSGTVIAGGGDWQIARSDGVLSLEARYTLNSTEGVLINVLNRGLRHAAPEVMERIARGEPVAPDSYYFRTSALFEAPVDSAYGWVNHTLFVGKAEREPGIAIIHFFRVR